MRNLLLALLVLAPTVADAALSHRYPHPRRGENSERGMYEFRPFWGTYQIPPLWVVPRNFIIDKKEWLDEEYEIEDDDEENEWGLQRA